MHGLDNQSGNAALREDLFWSTQELAPPRVQFWTRAGTCIRIEMELPPRDVRKSRANQVSGGRFCLQDPGSHFDVWGKSSLAKDRRLAFELVFECTLYSRCLCTKTYYTRADDDTGSPHESCGSLARQSPNERLRLWSKRPNLERCCAQVSGAVLKFWGRAPATF